MAYHMLAIFETASLEHYMLKPDNSTTSLTGFHIILCAQGHDEMHFGRTLCVDYCDEMLAEASVLEGR
jgi:hypothetical protein